MRPGRKGEWEVRRDQRLKHRPISGEPADNGHPMGAMAKNGADGAPGGDVPGNRSAKEKGGEEIRCGKMGGQPPEYRPLCRESWWAGCARQSSGGTGAEGNSPENRAKEKPEGRVPSGWGIVWGIIPRRVPHCGDACPGAPGPRIYCSNSRWCCPRRRAVPSARR